MKITNELLNEIYECTDGRCHICRKKIAFINYGRSGRRGCWEIDHSNPRSKGGTDRINNLKPACMYCNRSKGNADTRSVRAKNGYSKTPLSKKQKDEVRISRGIGGGLAGGVAGSVFGPLGAAIGAGLGAIVGHESEPDE